MSRSRLRIAAALVALTGAGVALGVVLAGGEETAPPAGASTSGEAGASIPAETRPAGSTAEAEPAAAQDEGALPGPEAQRRAVERLARSGLPVYCGGGRAGKIVALTFDDGPGAYTGTAMKILRRAGARATFFLVGRNLDAHPGLPRREQAFGALGNHSWSHPVLPDLPREELAAEVDRTTKAIEELSRGPVLLFRPPYGARSPAVDERVRSLGMLTVLWSIDTRDSIDADHDGIYRAVVDGLRPGAIVLMHENRGQTLRALRFQILPELKRRGYRAVSVPELLALDPPTRRQLRRGLAACA